MFLALLLQLANPVEAPVDAEKPEEPKGVAAEQDVTMPVFNPRSTYRMMRKAKAAQESGTRTENLTMDYLLWVNPKGKVLECAPLRIVGHVSYARKMCQRLSRLRAEPAKDRDGNAIHATYSSRISLNYFRHRSEVGQKMLGARFDMELPFKKFRDYPLVTSTVKVEADGSVSYCRAKWEYQNKQEEETNTKICDFLTTVPLHIRQDKSGNPVPYLRNVTVKLTG